MQVYNDLPPINGKIRQDSFQSPLEGAQFSTPSRGINALAETLSL